VIRLLCSHHGVLWLFGVLVAIGSVLEAVPLWHDGGCNTDKESVIPVFLTVCVGLCVASYFLSSAAFCAAGRGFQKRVWMHMGSYLLVAFLTNGPTCLYYFQGDRGTETFQRFAVIMLNASGVLYSVLYDVQARCHAPRPLRSLRHWAIRRRRASGKFTDSTACGFTQSEVTTSDEGVGADILDSYYSGAFKPLPRSRVGTSHGAQEPPEAAGLSGNISRAFSAEF
jgi:hypothetical protein